MENYDTECLCFYFQQNLYFPHLSLSEIYYMRQFWEYNFCIYSDKQQREAMFMRPKFKGKKGVNEVLSCLDYYVQYALPANVVELHLFLCMSGPKFERNNGYQAYDIKTKEVGEDDRNNGVWESFCIQNKGTEIIFTTQPLYKYMLLIKYAKITDVNKLCKYLTVESQAVIDSLTAEEGGGDDS
ncbi:hypothetical protein PR048_013452 [Dryococelus australis]|uniref:Uncharacterized protein n=1 Tax=Dryococelus australis TaxID=614101 RepID=A0ABQ9HS71_9NEOP|nr:hypothetical protein PR048_013452 [Dryococelus australis]